MAREAIRVSFQRLLVASAVGLYALQAYHTMQAAVDVPYRDEWQVIDPRIAQSYPDRSWLLTPHNEHIIATTKLLVWILYQLDGWDLRVHLLINILLFGALAALAIGIAYRAAPSDRVWLPMLLGLPLFSTLNWENHLWAFQTQFHLFLLFALGAAATLFTQRATKGRVVFGGLLLAAATLSFSAGFAAAGVLVGCYLVYSLRLRPTLQGLSNALIVLAACSPAMFAYQHLFAAGGSDSALILPHQTAFWHFFLNLVALGFGVETYSLTVGVLSGFLVSVSLLLLVAERRDESWAAIAGLVVILAGLASVAVGRAAQPDQAIWSKGSRYYEIAVLLLPFIGAGIAVWRHRAAAMLMTLTVGLTLVGHLNNWEFSVYRWTTEQKMQARACLLEKPAEECTMLWGVGTAAEIERAKQLRISLWRIP
ncbi:MAG: hypothetical protein KDD69_02840 [Bdellovibrionales bacterium]|nr:hypothetical protein [Bdellovibrionales bacterium]